MTRITGLAIGLTSTILAVCAGMHVDGQRNPTQRSATTWTADDVRRLFDDPSLHWCDRHHGHTGTRGPAWRCKGPYASVFANIEQLHQFDASVEDLLIDQLAQPAAGLASRAAETLGTWGVARAAPELLRQARAWHEGKHPERRLVVTCMVWALERTTSPQERASLSALGSNVPLGDLQPIVDHALTARSCNCPAPHRK